MRIKESSLLHQWFDEVWNKNNEDAIALLMSDDAAFQGLDESLPKGAPGFRTFFKQFTNQFHEINIEVEDVVSQDDMEAARTTIYAIHAETGKPVVVPGLCMARIEEGKIAEAWNSYDFSTLDEQVGKK
jgi:ketosteroid isomerase-like protein